VIDAVIDAHMRHDTAKPMRSINALLPIGVMLVGMVRTPKFKTLKPIPYTLNLYPKPKP